MASVRLTNDLRDHIRNNAVKAFDAANPLWKPSNEFQGLVKKAALESEHQKLAKHVADTFVTKNLKTTHFGIKRMAPEEKPITNVSLIRNSTQEDVDKDFIRSLERSSEISIEFDFDSAISLYCSPGMYGGVDTGLDITTLPAEYRSELTDYMNQGLQAKQDRREKFDNYYQSIRDLLDNCNTLKQLLETWPAVESLVPEQFIQKLHEKVDRKQAAKTRREAINFNAEAANQTVLTAKLVGG